MKNFNLNKMRYTHWLGPKGFEMVVVSDKNSSAFGIIASSMSPTLAPPMAVFTKALAYGGFNPNLRLKGWLAFQLNSKTSIDELCRRLLSQDTWLKPYYEASLIITPPPIANHFCQFVTLRNAALPSPKTTQLKRT